MTNKNPIISINLKYSWIVIHKLTLKLLGNPEYIQILVNPAEKSIVLCRSTEKDHLAQHVRKDVFTSCKVTYRIHSHLLVKGLQKTYPAWNNENTYQIKGKFMPALNIIKFRMKDSEIVTDNGGDNCYE